MDPSAVVPVALGLAILVWSFLEGRFEKRRAGIALRMSFTFDIAMAICVQMAGIFALIAVAHHPVLPALKFAWWLCVIAPVGILTASYVLRPFRK